MAQDEKYNLGPNHTYDVEDVDRLLQTVNEGVEYFYYEYDDPIDDDSFLQRAACFHYRARLNNPQNVSSLELADQRTRTHPLPCQRLLVERKACD
jgi:hypothetical protein